jgi:fructosamine-3-kinase
VTRAAACGLNEQLQRLLGEPVLSAESVTGGDINQALVLTLASGRRVFAKTHAAAPAGVFQREAEGLAWLADARALRVPAVLAASDADEHGPACLVLEQIESGPRAKNYDELLGRGLAALHRSGAPCFGLARANYLASLPQDNAPCASWPEFYAHRRLLPLLTRAEAGGVMPARLAARVREVCERMPELTGEPEPPARLHGDLWGGNVIVADGGEPCLIDPAVYGGHREVDLAMMRLFGGFSQRVFDAYDEAHPLPPGHEERVALYQLYPILAHVNLFGRGYVDPLDRALRAYA